MGVPSKAVTVSLPGSWHCTGSISEILLSAAAFRASRLFSSMAGAAASDRKDFNAVADYWGRLQLQLEPGSEEARSVEAAVNKAREIVAGEGGKTAEKPAAAPPPVKAISGDVILGEKLAAQARPDDTLFIFARPAEGSRMPLAVLRARAGDSAISTKRWSFLPEGMADANRFLAEVDSAVVISTPSSASARSRPSKPDWLKDLSSNPPSSETMHAL